MANLAARRSLVRVVARGLSSPSSASPSSTSSRFASALVDKAYLTRLSPQPAAEGDDHARRLRLRTLADCDGVH
ncbi:hypothetical protein LINPERPRIM_LOCUS17678 [Linum perenne]